MLHIIDYYLPETMNWLEKQLQCTSKKIEHHVAAIYYSGDKHEFIQICSIGIKSSYPVPTINKLRSQFLIHLWKKELDNYIQREKINAVHFHFGNMAIRFSDWLINLKCPKFISLYGFDYEYLPNKEKRTIDYYKKFSDHGAVFLVEGHYSKNLLLNYGISKDSISIVRMYFDRFSLFQTIPLFQPVQLIQVASYSEKKGQLLLLQSLSRFKNRSAFQITMHGEQVDKNYSKELKNIVEKEKLNVALGNKISTRNYINKLKQSHVAVNLSRRSKENDTEGGCPVFIKDAWSCSKPVFTSWHCDIPEFAIHDYNSWLIEENSISDCLEQLNRINAISARNYLKMCHNSYSSAQAYIRNEVTLNDIIRAYNI